MSGRILLTPTDVDAVRRATFRRARSGWRCNASGFEAVGLGKTKSEAQRNLRNLLILTRAAGFGVAPDTERGPPGNAHAERRMKILNHITGKSKRMKRLISEEEKALASERQRWERITNRLGRLIYLKRIKRNRGESIANAVTRLIGCKTDEDIQRMLYELESGEPT